jgi:SNF2 family DNA or RNA helicase
MGKSLIIKANCPTCGKIAKEISRMKFSHSILIRLECGHIIPDSKLEATDYSTIKSTDNPPKELMQYQIDGVKFVEESGANCLIADEQGLGKTIQTLAVLKLHQQSLCPALIITKTSIKQQWMYELIRWTQNYKVQVIKGSKEVALPGMDFYVATYDLLKSADVFNYVEIRTLVLDECQAIKNHTSGRAKAVQDIKTNHKIEHVIGLSGTPIKNHAGEYFTILNLLRPTMFPEYYGFLRRWCDSYEGYYGTKVGGLINPELFHDFTKDFIIRRTKDEVLKDLPKLSRNFYHCSMDSKFGAAYKKALKELEDLMYQEDSFEVQSNKLAIMNKMRQITGISKVETCVDFVTDWMLSNDKPITIFTHHDDVRTLLQHKLNEWMEAGNYPKVLMMTSDLNADKREDVISRFRAGEARVMIASTLAAGEGLNLQFCADAIMLERQWNPANEEQAESRFHRYGQEYPVTITYMIATKTIDEIFTELVEHKRAIVAGALDNKQIDWNQQSLMSELSSILTKNGWQSFQI